MKALVAIPVYNEEKNLPRVLPQVLKLGIDVLVVDDGSSDGSLAVARSFAGVKTIQQPRNMGYGAALRTAFQYAADNGYEVVVTFDGDGQHDATLIPKFIEACRHADVVSGSRYLQSFDSNTAAPSDRRRINMLLTDAINAMLKLHITDAFCGFKAFRTEAVAKLDLTEDGYAQPMEFWVQAACKKLKIVELAVPRIYLDPNRTFGENLDDADRRLAYYQDVLDEALQKARRHQGCGIGAGEVRG
jgi:glycosyltransferase involved in cell wall biosynthesis